MIIDYPIVCHTLLPDSKEVVLVNLADVSNGSKTIDLGDFRFKAFVGWDSASIDARIGIIAQNSKNENEVRLFWVIVDQPYVKVCPDDLQFIRIEQNDMIFNPSMISEMKNIRRAHFVGQQNS